MGVALGLLGLVLAASSCASAPDPDEAAPMSPPDRGQFIDGGVSAFMERRCGTLDCHGQIGRPLRIYSQNGLRKTDPNHPDAPRPATATTTFDEETDNYFAVIDLEPEAIGYSNSTKGAYRDFMLLKKPLGLENNGVRHKGGPVLREVDDPGYTCLVSWIGGAVSTKDCTAATF
jgi:hypothetical protein